MTLMGSSFMTPLRIWTRSEAAAPSAREPELPSCVCIQGTPQGVA